MIEDKTIQFADPAEQEGYVCLPRAILYNSDLSDGAKLLYAALRGFAWDAEDCWPGQDRLADDLGVSGRTVRARMTELVDAGLIDVERRGLNRTNRYLLTRLSTPDRKKTSAPDRKPASDKVKEEGIEQANSGAEEVFRHYLSAFPNKRQKKADEGQRKTIRNALEHGSVDELKRCIDACAGSDWHQKSGEYAGRKGGKHNSLSLILAPKTRGANYPSGRSQREQIDYWLAREPASTGPSQQEIDEWNHARARFLNGDGPDPGASPWEKA